MLGRLESYKRDWTIAQWKASIEAARADLICILKDLSTLIRPGIVPAFSRSVATYLVRQPNPTKLSEVRTDLGVLIRRVLTVLMKDWHYNVTILSSIAERDSVRSQNFCQSKGIQIFFFDEQSNHLAAANLQLRAIYINIGLLSNRDPSTDSLVDLFRHLRPREALDDLYGTLTPILLHECLHLARNDIKDVWIKRENYPQPVNISGEVQPGPDDYMTCYGERGCRMLTRLAHEQFAHAESVSRRGKPYLPHEITFKNCDSITRALCSIWLSHHRQDLDFFSFKNPQRPTIASRINRIRCVRRPNNKRSLASFQEDV